jgi:hypothetical protein
MPSVEIVCVGQSVPTQFEDVPFRVPAENRLVSHRTPSPLFQADFDALSGCIYHLVKQPNGAATAYSLLDEWWEVLRFKPEYVPPVGRILSELLAASPQRRLVFTSDYQFGPDAKRFKRPVRISRFWELHMAGRLRANTLYSLIQDKPA